MMTRRVLAVITAAMLAVVPTALRAQTSLSIAGGANAPVGALGDITDLGFNIGAGLNLGKTSIPIATRFELAYNGLGLKKSSGLSGDVRIISGSANAIFNVGKTPDAPYLMAGLGVYNRSFSISSRYGSGKTALGINGGGGLRFPLSGLSTFFEARYHVMLGNGADATNYQFIPITFGIMF